MISGDDMKKHYNCKGFTLIEILLSLAILSIIIIPISSFFISSQKISRDSDIKFRSITLAQNYFEQIKSKDFETIESIEGIEWIGGFNPSENNIGIINNGDFKVEIKIEPVPEYPKNGNSNNNENIDYDIDYDIKIEVHNDNVAQIYKSGSDFPYSIINVNDKFKMLLLQKKLKTEPNIIIINNIDKLVKSEIIILIELYANMDFEISNNNKDKTLVFYIIKEQDSTVDYDFNVKKGKVIKQEETVSDEAEESEDFILYKVNINIYDKNENNLIKDNIITDVTGYKSIY